MPNDILQRTGMIGDYNEDYTTFDDYFEKHTEKFFTPEMHEITIYHSPGYILGLHCTYRDPWGKFDKETYKGNVQLPKNMNAKNCESVKLTFEYDDFPKEIYIDGTEYIHYIKIVSSKGKKIEVGKASSPSLVNQVPELGRILGVGGAISLCLNAIYFYFLGA
jgi:hypothetical protein